MVPIYFVLFILLLNLDKVYVNFQAVELEEHKQILEEFELFLANYTFWNKVEQDLNFIHDKEEKGLQFDKLHVKAKHDWTYTGRYGVEFWSERYPSCGGWKQSPINIDTSLVLFRDDIPRLHLHHYQYITDSNTRLINNGRTLEMKFQDNGHKPPTLFGGPLREKYTLIGGHFHWGANDCMGSEHTINGIRFPIDLHLVHQTRGPRNQLAVTAFQFEVVEHDNHALAPITSQVEYLIESGSSTSPLTGFYHFNLLSLLSPVLSLSGYFTYSGSLTTPPCSEIVTWIVFQDAIKISRYQLEMFRKLWDENGDNIVNNFRNVQPLFNRSVLYSYNI